MEQGDLREQWTGKGLDLPARHTKSLDRLRVKRLKNDMMQCYRCYKRFPFLSLPEHMEEHRTKAVDVIMEEQ